MGVWMTNMVSVFWQNLQHSWTKSCSIGQDYPAENSQLLKFIICKCLCLSNVHTFWSSVKALLLQQGDFFHMDNNVINVINVIISSYITDSPCILITGQFSWLSHQPTCKAPWHCIAVNATWNAHQHQGCTASFPATHSGPIMHICPGTNWYSKNPPEPPCQKGQTGHAMAAICCCHLPCPHHLLKCARCTIS